MSKYPTWTVWHWIVDVVMDEVLDEADAEVFGYVRANLLEEQ